MNEQNTTWNEFELKHFNKNFEVPFSKTNNNFYFNSKERRTKPKSISYKMEFANRNYIIWKIWNMRNDERGKREPNFKIKHLKLIEINRNK